MATPYDNAVAMTSLNFAGLSTWEAGLIDRWKWGDGGYGNGVTLTYSFPWAAGEAPVYSGYGGFGNEWISAPTSDYALNSEERSAVTQVLNEVEQAADITFVQTADNGSTVGELRFTETDDSNYAHAYLPYNDTVRSGDVWFAHRWWNPGGETVSPGSYEYLTIVHEVGHALGLKHSFEEGESGVALPPENDNYLWSVMSYRAYAGAGPDVWANFYPTTLMYLDLVALEKMYGAPRDANLGNTEYVYREDRRYWETISDSGGIDTIVYEASTDGCLIDLSNGNFSRMGRPVRFSDGTMTRDTLCTGPSTIIENATGGDGDDRLLGNFKANRLVGRGGHDQLIGDVGADYLIGGVGRDRLAGGAGNDTLSGGSGKDRLMAGPGNDLLYFEQAGDRLSDEGGTDTVRSWVESYALNDGLENLQLAAGARTGIGNQLANVIEGNVSDNLLSGGAGPDLLAGAGGHDSLNGGGGDDTMAGGAGNDTLNGGIGRDRLAGGDGDDVLVWDRRDARVDGGADIDTLVASGDLDLSAIADGIIAGIEQLDFSDTGASLLTLAQQDILDLFGGTLTILGDGTDTVDIVDAFTPGTEADGFRTYAVGAATLLVDTEIPVTNVV